MHAHPEGPPLVGEGHPVLRPGWRVDGLLTSFAELRPWIAVVVAAAGLLGCWAVSFAVGGARVAPHWFYVPILFSAARFGPSGAAATAIAAGVLAGPLLPLDVSRGVSQEVADWVVRAGSFLVLGALMSLVMGRRRTLFERELDLARRERDFALRTAEAIQTISHELRTPLTTIAGTGRTLQHQGAVEPGARPLLTSLLAATARLESLVETVGSIAGSHAPEPDAPEAAPLEKIAGEVARKLDGLGTPARLRIAASGLVWGRPDVVERILVCLVENALRFSPPDSVVDLHGQAEDDVVRITIRDHGPGIDEAFLEHAFEPFTQQDQSTTRERGGLGIGLFVARILTERLSGGLQVDRHPRGGTEARLVLPQVRSPG